MYKIFTTLMFFLVFNLQGQTVSGHVYDETHTPLEGAVVYFDGTSISVSTDSKGYFSIKGDKNLPAPLVINFIGFEPISIKNPFTGNRLEIILTPDAIIMDEVVVTGKTIFSRKEMLRAFREQFLGNSKAGSSCKIENEDDIRLRFDTSNNILYAEAVKPLRIRNERLKYVVTFNLAASEIRYRAKSLNPYDISGAFFGGTTFFTDFSNNGNGDKPRKEAYLGSPMHFIKTAINEDWEQQNFKLYRGKRSVNPKEYIEIKDTLGIKKITISETKSDVALSLVESGKEKPKEIKQKRFEVRHKKSESFMLYDTGVFYANTNGLFWPLQELTFGGYMGDLRIGDLLPADYKVD